MVIREDRFGLIGFYVNSIDGDKITTVTRLGHSNAVIDYYRETKKPTKSYKEFLQWFEEAYNCKVKLKRSLK